MLTKVSKYLFICCTMIGLATGAVFAQEPVTVSDDPVPEKENDGDAQDDEGWRVALAPAMGEMMLDLKVKLGFTYVDPDTGRTVPATIGRRFTDYGSLDFQARGLGPQQAILAFLSNGSWTFSGSYSKVRVNFSPLRDDQLLPLTLIEGSANGETYSASGEYQHKNSTIFAPHLSYKYSGVRANYDVRNVIGFVPGPNIYEAFPSITAKDGSRTHAARTGVRIRLPIQNWYIGPYWQFAGDRYTIKVLGGQGTTSTSTALLPDDPQDLVRAWHYQGDREAYTFDAISTTRNNNESGGLEVFMDYKRFLSLKIDARRNYERASWSITTTALFFFHPNVGIMAVGVYNEPENGNTFSRSFGVGPVATFKF